MMAATTYIALDMAQKKSQVISQGFLFIPLFLRTTITSLDCYELYVGTAQDLPGSAATDHDAALPDVLSK